MFGVFAQALRYWDLTHRNFRSFVRKLLVDVGNTDTSHILKNLL
jgi:hypothetical protein